MKNLLIKAIGVMIIALCTVQLLSAQGNTYKLDGNNNGTSNSKLGFTNSVDLKFITDGLVRQTITKEGDVIIENNLKLTNGKIMADSINIRRILPPEGDSIICFGEHSIQMNTNNNRILWSPVQVPPWQPMFWTRGLTIANGTSAARGQNSMAFGNNAVVNFWADNSFAIGNNIQINLGVDNSIAVGYGFTNNISNSFMLGWNGVTFFANPTHVGIGTTTPLTKLHVASSDGVDGLITSDPLAFAGIGPLLNTDGLVIANNSGTMYTKINFTGNSSDVLLGDGSFGNAPPPTGGPFWEIDGNNNATPPLNNRLGTTNPIDLMFIVSNNPRQFIRASDGFIGINTTNPQSRLHLNENNAVELFSQWTNINTPNDGFLVGINSDGVAELRQQEDLPIRIFTNEGLLHEQRMIISHDAGSNFPRVGIGTSVLTNPRTYLQVGFDCNITGNGYRDWMDIGELVVNDQEDNMYFGFTGRLFGLSDHVINWGSRDSITEQNRLRFVNTSGVDITIPSGSHVGLEVARMVVSNGEIGRMGIGNFFALGEDPTETLDVDGNARIRDLINHQDESLTRCVVINDDGVLHWRNFEVGGPGTSLGNECDGPITNPLNVNWEIPLDDYNFVFSGQVQDKTRVGIGIDDCQPDAKLDVLMNSGESGSIALKSVVENGENSQIGIFGHSTTSSPLALGIGIFGLSQYSNINMGVTGIAWNAIPAIMDATYNFGGFFMADYGRINAAGYFNAPSNDPSSVNNYGVYSVCQPPVTGAYGNWAGYFLGHVNVEGNIQHTGTYTNTSDQKFKQDIVDYSGALGKIRDLRPVNFYFDTVNYDLNFPTDMQYGLIAQEVETVLPELVSNQIIPEKFDTAGNIISEVIHYKGLEYGQLTPILVQAVKELDSNLTEIVRIPEPPVLISPENNDTVYSSVSANRVSGFSETFTWHPADGALCYIADYSYSSDMSDIFESQVAFDTDLLMGFPYKNDTVVYWAVRSVGAFGLSDYSEIRYFVLHYTYDDNYTKSVSELSDINLKTNVNEIEDALTKTMSLQGVSFEWDIANNPGRNLSEGTNLGLVAQEVQPIFPEVVSSDENGILYIDYSSLIPVLIESVKELKYINDSLSESVNMLESRLDNLEQLVLDNLGEVEAKNAHAADFQQEVILVNQLAIVLNQNVPNPFREQTTISFQIPETVKEAMIVFIDNLGNILKQVEIQERGNGELLVYAYDLSAGNYTYYLVADGITIDSKKMVLTK